MLINSHDVMQHHMSSPVIFTRPVFLLLRRKIKPTDPKSQLSQDMPAFNGEKLRVNLRLSVNRLKLLEKKKSESESVYWHNIIITFFNNL